MTQSKPHPSFLALDRLALGATDDPALKAHVAECAHCQEHLGRVVASPPHARRTARGRAKPERIRTTPTRGMWAGGVLVAAAALGLAWIPWAPSLEQPAFTTRRGAASVGIYVKRDGQVWLWDGQRPIEPGDRLRLSIAPEGFTHVAVFTRSRDDGPWTLLYRAPLPPQDPRDPQALLPTAWEVDPSPGPERLRVVLSDGPVDAEEAAQGGDAEGEGDLWIRSFEIPKRTNEPKPSAGEAR